MHQSINQNMEISIQGKRATILRKWSVNPDYYVIVVFYGETKEHIIFNQFNF